MIDNDYYVDNTDEVFAAASLGTPGQGFKTLLKHFIPGFFLFAAITIIFALCYFFVHSAIFNQEARTLDYFKNTDENSITVTYINYNQNNNKYEQDLRDRLSNHKCVDITYVEELSYKKSHLADTSKMNEYAKRLLFCNAVPIDYLDLEELGCTLICGSLPTTSTEVAIPKYYFELFKLYGYQDGNIKIQINNPEDLLGKEFLGLYIVGVVDTKLVLSEDEIRTTVEKDTAKYDYEMRNTIHNSIFVKLSSPAYKYHSNYAGGAISVVLNHDETDMVFYEINQEQYGDDFSCYAYNKDSETIWDASIDLHYKEGRDILKLTTYSAIGLAVISSLLLSIGSFRDKKKIFAKLNKREYEPREFLELFIPEVVIVLVCAAIMNALFWGIVHSLSAGDPWFSGVATIAAWGAILGAACVILAMAMLGTYLKINRKYKIKDEVKDRMML